MRDFVIVGDGIAGTCIAWQMWKHGYNFLLVGDHHPRSSNMAAGIINPITGRNFVLSWRYHEIFEYLVSFYSNLPINDHFLHMQIFRAINSPKAMNQLSIQQAEQLSSAYVDQISYEVPTRNLSFENVLAWLKIKNGGRLDIEKFLTDSHVFFDRNSAYQKSEITKGDISLEESLLSVRGFNAKGYVFAEGAPVPRKGLIEMDVRPQKGERLLFRSEDLQINFIVKNKYFIVPLGESIYWLGSNYQPGSLEERPTRSFYQEATKFLEQSLIVPFEILEHGLGFRPATPSRKPIIGKHDTYTNAYFMNGLGSKGSSLAPLFSEMLIGMIVDNNSST